MKGRGARTWHGGENRRAPQSLAQVIRTHVLMVLAAEGGHRERAAKALGVSKRWLYYHLHHAKKDNVPVTPGSPGGFEQWKARA